MLITIFALTLAGTAVVLGFIVTVAAAIKALPIIWRFMYSLAKGFVAFADIAPKLESLASDANDRSVHLDEITADIKSFHSRLDEHLVNEEAELNSTNAKLEDLTKLVHKLLTDKDA